MRAFEAGSECSVEEEFSKGSGGGPEVPPLPPPSPAAEPRANSVPATIDCCVMKLSQVASTIEKARGSKVLDIGEEVENTEARKAEWGKVLWGAPHKEGTAATSSCVIRAAKLPPRSVPQPRQSQ